MLKRLLPTTRVALILILLGAAWWGGWATWIATRTWVPLDDTPVVAAGRHIRTPEFEINLTGSYGFMIGPLAPPTSESKWMLLRDGHLVAQRWGGPEAYPCGHFSAGSGRYVLELDTGRDGSGLPNDRAYVRIVKVGGGREAAESWAQLAIVFWFPALALGAFRLLTALRREEIVTSLTQPGTHGPAPAVDHRIRHPWERWKSPRRPFTGLSWFSLLILHVIVFLNILFAIDHCSVRIPTGLPIRLLRPGIQSTRMPHLEPLLITVGWAGYGVRPTLYFNSKPITWEELPALLDKELLRRPPDWPVYVQGDDNLEWQQVVYAIDIVRGKGAQVVLLTRKE